MTDLPHNDVLAYLFAARRANPDAEVSGVELQRELCLDQATVSAVVSQMAEQGLVESDLFLSNLWLRITDKGVIAAARFDPPAV